MIYLSFMLISEARLNFSFTASIGLSKRSAERRGGTPWHYLKGAQEHFQDCGFALATMLGLICACQIEERCCTLVGFGDHRNVTTLLVAGFQYFSSHFNHRDNDPRWWAYFEKMGLKPCLFEMKAFPRVGGRGYHMSPGPLLVLEFVHPL